MARITFIGAAGVVTGSKHLVETDEGARVLLDCGLYQGMRDLTERNWTPPPVDPKTLTAVVLSHAHLDHCGYLPALVQQGFRGPIYTTAATAETAALVLHDSAHLQQEEADRAALHPGRGMHPKPLYTDDDVNEVVRRFSAVPYDDIHTDIPGCRFRLSDAGHILGSAIIELWFDQHKLTFTGDIGRYGRPLLRDPSPIAESDYVLCESTYGDRDHPASDPQDDLRDVINAAMQRGGVLVIPAFAIGRTQEILYAIGQLQRASAIPQVDVHLDSPMAIAADAIMAHNPEAMRIDLRSMFGSGDLSIGCERFNAAQTAEQSKALNAVQSNAIIISSSGMASGGRILHHLRNRLPRKADTVCFCGFQGPGTLGNELVKGARSVKIFGESVPVNAFVTRIDGFSAHADRTELLRWFGNFQNKPEVYIVHGEASAAASLAAAVTARYGFQSQPAKQGEVLQIGAPVAEGAASGD